MPPEQQTALSTPPVYSQEKVMLAGETWATWRIYLCGDFSIAPLMAKRAGVGL